VVPADVLPAEAWFAAARPEIVVSCFSTALLTASCLFDLPVATVGGELILERINPYENSNRIPATIVEAVVPELRVDGSIVDPPSRDVGQLVQAVGYCMQPRRHPDLRAVALDYLAVNGRALFFKKRRLENLGLVPLPRYRSIALRRAVRRGRRLLAKLTSRAPKSGSPPT
jgi:hypothetical protein